MIGFVVVERRSPAPLVDLQLMRNKLLIGATLGILIGAGTINGLMFVVSLYFQDPETLGMSPLEAGLATLPATIGLVVSAPLVPKWAAKFGTRQIVALGFAITAGGFVALMAIKSSWEYGVFVIPFLAAAVGMSMSNGPCSSVSTSAVPVEQVGAASGISNMARYVGAAVMTSVAAAVYGSVSRRPARCRQGARRRTRSRVLAGRVGDGHHLGARHPPGVDDGSSSLDEAGGDRRLRGRSRLQLSHNGAFLMEPSR